jgi:hypothetical protein
MEAGIPYVRVYADRQGRSRLEERVIRLDGELAAPPAEPLKSASLLATLGAPEDAMLVAGDSSWAGSDPHPAPARLLFAILAGEWQVTVDAGVTRSFTAGELVLFEDTTGSGHSSRLLTDGSVALVLRLS